MGADVDPDHLPWFAIRMLATRGVEMTEVTSQLGYFSATAMGQAAEPKPQSKIFRGLETGGKISLLSKIIWKRLCILSNRSRSSCGGHRHQQGGASEGGRATSSMGVCETPLSSDHCWYRRPLISTVSLAKLWSDQVSDSGLLLRAAL